MRLLWERAVLAGDSGPGVTTGKEKKPVQAHLCSTLTERVPLYPAEDAPHKLLVELCVDHLEALDVAEGEGKVGRVGAGA